MPFLLTSHGTEMHRVFQRDLCKLRLSTARAYIKIISDGGQGMASGIGANLRLNAQACCHSLVCV